MTTLTLVLQTAWKHTLLTHIGLREPQIRLGLNSPRAQS